MDKRAVKVNYLICEDFVNRRLPGYISHLCYLTQYSRITKTANALST